MFENAKWITRTPSVRWGFEEDPAKLPPSPYLARSFTVQSPVPFTLCLGKAEKAYPAGKWQVAR